MLQFRREINKLTCS